MKVKKASVLYSAALAMSAALLTVGCGGTTRKTILATDSLKVVAITQTTLDINVSKYKHYTTYALYLEGDKLSDAAFAGLLQDAAATGEQIVHTDAIVVADDAVLLASRTRDGSACWATHLSAQGGKARLEKIITSTTDCSPRPASPGWSALYDEASNLVLVRTHPFAVHPITGYWQVLWIEGDVVALYEDERAKERLVVKLVRISADETLAEQYLPMNTYAQPDLLHAAPEARRQWLFDNFSVSLGTPASIQLRPDNTLKTLTPEVWAEYQEMDRQNKEADARARAEGQARLEALYREVREAEATNNHPASRIK